MDAISLIERYKLLVFHLDNGQVGVGKQPSGADFQYGSDNCVVSLTISNVVFGETVDAAISDWLTQYVP